MNEASEQFEKAVEEAAPMDLGTVACWVVIAAAVVYFAARVLPALTHGVLP